MLSEIQIPKPLISPFHRIFSAWKFDPSLEQTLKESRTGGRGSKAKRQKGDEREGGSHFPRKTLLPFFGLSVPRGCIFSGLAGSTEGTSKWTSFRIGGSLFICDS